MEMQEWLNWIVPIGTVLAALISARASKVSANAARRSNAAAFAALEENRKIAQNDWRIRLMDERMKVWHAFDTLMKSYEKWLYVVPQEIETAKESFQFSQFLFEREISDYLNELCSKLLEHYIIDEWNKKTLGGSNCLETREEVNEQKARLAELRGWLATQEMEGKRLFSRHMSILS